MFSVIYNSIFCFYKHELKLDLFLHILCLILIFYFGNRGLGHVPSMRNMEYASLDQRASLIIQWEY